MQVCTLTALYEYDAKQILKKSKYSISKYRDM